MESRSRFTRSVNVDPSHTVFLAHSHFLFYHEQNSSATVFCILIGKIHGKRPFSHLERAGQLWYDVACEGKKRRMARGRRNMKIIKALLLVVLILVLAAGGLVGYLTLTEYRPDEIEQLEVTQAARSDNVRVGERLDVLSFNTGYCGLGRDQDFFMD